MSDSTTSDQDAAEISDLSVEDPFFRKVISDTSSIAHDNTVVLNVPVWGYPNHGKTTAILTAIYFCEPDKHGLSLSLVNDPADLQQLGEMDGRKKRKKR